MERVMKKVQRNTHLFVKKITGNVGYQIRL